MRQKFNLEIAVGITTFLRDKSLFRLVSSLQKYYPEIKMYIVDQGIKTGEKTKFYESLLNMGHQINYISYNCGISKGRKILKEVVKEPFLLYAEDDFEIDEKANIYKLLEIIKQDKSLGVIGGQCYNFKKNELEFYNYFFAKADKSLLYIPASYYLELKLLKWNKVKDNEYHYTDIIADYSLWRKEISPDVFDENVCQVEHSFIYLKLKYETKWKVGFCPECIVNHYHDNSNSEYNKYRRGNIERREKDLSYIKKYWKINNFVYLDKTGIINKISQPQIVVKKLPEIKLDKNINNKISNTIKKPLILSQLNSYEIIEKLYKAGLTVCLMGKTCYTAIIYSKIDNKLHIATTDNEKAKKLTEGYDITFFDIPIATKGWSHGKCPIRVPKPVVNYLIDIGYTDTRNILKKQGRY